MLLLFYAINQKRRECLFLIRLYGFEKPLIGPILAAFDPINSRQDSKKAI